MVEPGAGIRIPGSGAPQTVGSDPDGAPAAARRDASARMRTMMIDMMTTAAAAAPDDYRLPAPHSYCEYSGVPARAPARARRAVR
mmetsp:Transcript_7296/g.21388  ORF Transcript_7296/g.21388 Transcript_7296/m.21388 type:complete len:85 (-) Transcript_7296:209-463(-)